MTATFRLYIGDAYLRDFEAVVLDNADGWCALSCTAFFPGGGGQPADSGHLVARDRLGAHPAGAVIPVSAVREDSDGRIWHSVGRDLVVGETVRGVIDWPQRYALMRHHGLMHIVNTVALREYGGMITGVQLGTERSRIDLKLLGFARSQIVDFEARVNEVIEKVLPIIVSSVDESEYRRRPDLVRTLNVSPRVVGGRVRIVEVKDFDVQACGGTHVRSTGEIGRAHVVRFDNKGSDNKRFYWEVEAVR